MRIWRSGYSVSNGPGGSGLSPGAACFHTCLKMALASTPPSTEPSRPTGRYSIFADALDCLAMTRRCPRCQPAKLAAAYPPCAVSSTSEVTVGVPVAVSGVGLDAMTTR